LATPHCTASDWRRALPADWPDHSGAIPSDQCKASGRDLKPDTYRHSPRPL